MTNLPVSKNFGIYIHWPFCAAKCPYCDFNSHVSSQIDTQEWLASYRTALSSYRSEMGQRLVRSVYFGGGTPSLMPVALVDGILEAIRSHWSLANDIEITLEANPTSVEAERFQGYRTAGVNRVSMGFQAMDNDDLRKLGRQHTVDEALAAWEVAQLHFDRTNFDLIYARQGQSLDAWEKELRDALSRGPDHLSLYQLTIEPNTAFGKRMEAGGLKGLPGEDRAADMFYLTQSVTAEAGLEAYEISNHARPGQESKHNILYWTGGEYLGIGPGAHGRIHLSGRRIATETALAPQKWLETVRANGTGETIRQELSRADQLNELLMMGLRLRTGIANSDLKRLGFQRNQSFSDLIDLGFIEDSSTRLRTTEAGRPLLNEILRQILT